MKTPVDSYRIVINANELKDTIYDLELFMQSNPICEHTKSFHKKLKVLAVKSDIGLVVPTYQTTGRKAGISLDDLDQKDMNNPINNYTPEQKLDAEIEAANHYAMTGERKPWIAFINKDIPIDSNNDIEQIENHLPSDADIFSKL